MAVVIPSLLLPPMVVAYLLTTHFGSHFVASDYYWVPSRDSFLLFLTLGLQREVNLLIPLKLTSPVTALLFLALALVLFFVVWFLSRRKDPNPFLTWASFLVLLLILAEIVAGSATSRYPFAGELRHQYILCPFLAVSFFVVTARLSRLLTHRVVRVSVASATLAGIVVSSYTGWLAQPRVPGELFAADYSDFRSAVGHSDLICVDLFSLIGYFGHTHDWKWKSEWRYDRGMQPLIVYLTTSPTGEKIRVLRNKVVWNWDLKDPATYMVMVDHLRSMRRNRMTLFYLAQIPDGLSWAERESTVERLALGQGLRLEKAYPLPGGMVGVFSLK